MPVIEIKTKKDFDNYKNGQALVVVDFFATWCGPCKMAAPKVEELSVKYPSVVFLKVDVDELQELATEYKITAMPTFRLYKAKNEVFEVVGADIRKLEEAIKSNM